MTAPDIENDMAMAVAAGVLGLDLETVLLYESAADLDISISPSRIAMLVLVPPRSIC